MILTSGERLQLHDALQRAFPDVATLSLMVNLRMGEPLTTFASILNPLPTVVLDLIQAAEAQGRLEALVEGAHAHNPGSPRLKAFYESMWPTIKARSIIAQPQADPAPTPLPSLTAIREVLTDLFNFGELKGLAFEFGFDLDDLPGQSKSEKAQEMVQYMRNRQRLRELVATIRRERPKSSL